MKRWAHHLERFRTRWGRHKGRHRRSGHRRSRQPHHYSGNLPLNALRPHQSGIVTKLLGGHSLLNRMATLGFTPGAEVKMVQNFGHGPLIVLVRGARVALGRGEAYKVRVRTADDG